MKNKKTRVILITLIILIILGIFIFMYVNKEKDKNIGNTLKTYKSGGVEFYSTRNFKETSYEKFSISYEDAVDNMLILGLEEKKDYLETLNLKDLTLEKYINILYENEKNTKTKIEKRNNYYYYTYTYETDNSQKFYYIVTTYEGKESFYLINFVCLFEEKDNHIDEFLELADSVKVK